MRVLGARAQLGAAVGELVSAIAKRLSAISRKIRLSETSPISGPGSPIYFWTIPGGLTASWELDFWGKFRRAIESADAACMAAVADYDNALVSLTGDVATAYISAADPGKAAGHCPAECGGPEAGLRIATARWKGGTTSKRDVEQALTVLDRHRSRPSPPWKASCGRRKTLSACSWACRPAT